MGIREATQEDAHAISDLIARVVETFLAPELSAEGQTNLLASMAPARVRQYLHDGFRYHVYEEQGEILGVVATRDERHLFNLFVAERAQRRGIARLLWEVARKACLDAGGDGSFTVNSSRYAVSVYERLGFKRNGSDVTKDGITCVPMLSTPT